MNRYNEVLDWPYEIQGSVQDKIVGIQSTKVVVILRACQAS